MVNKNSNGKVRLKDIYETKLCLQLKNSLKLNNVMAVPRLSKIVLNVGVGRDVVNDSRVIAAVEKTLANIAGQAPIRTKARKSIATFKIREGMPLGVCVTLRRASMFNFLDKLISIALPRVRDFQGVSDKFDGQGNYNLGIKEWNIFPEADTIGVEKVFGMNISIHTTAKNNQDGYELLKSFGMPFKTRRVK